jgi:hypothetical protein
MFSKIPQRFRLFANQISKTPFFKAIKENQRPLEDITFVTGMSSLMYWSYKNKNRWIEREIRLFKSSLTPEQRKEMESSPEKNQQYLEEFKDKLRQSMGPD